MFLFDLNLHIYTLDGIRLPSITGLLKSEGYIDCVFYDERGRERGQEVHRTCHLDDIDDLVEESVSDEIMGYLSGWRKFKADNGYTHIRAEIPMYHAIKRFAGTPDRDCEVKGHRAIVEIKSGSLAPWTAIQTALQQLLCEDEDRRAGLQHLLRKRYAVHLPGNSTYKLIEYKDRTDRAVAESLILSYKWKRNNLRGNYDDSDN